MLDHEACTQLRRMSIIRVNSWMIKTSLLPSNKKSSQEPPKPHEHVFSAIAGMVKTQTLEARKDGACWACHLSKAQVYRTLVISACSRLICIG
jgi:hypothetical protein